MINEARLRYRLNRLLKDIRSLKATIPLDGGEGLSSDSLRNFNHHLKRVREELNDAATHTELAIVILERRDEIK